MDDYTSGHDISDDGAPSTIYLGETDHVQTPPSATDHHTVCPALAKLKLLHGSKLTDWESSIITHAFLLGKQSTFLGSKNGSVPVDDLQPTSRFYLGHIQRIADRFKQLYADPSMEPRLPAGFLEFLNYRYATAAE